MKLLSFVIPCYRSEKTIEGVIEEIVETVHQRPEYDYEIICVNDESPDDVYSVLCDIAANNTKVKVIDLAMNMGKASAVMAGYSLVKGDYIVTLDDDGQCPAYDLWKLIEPLENNECDVSTAHYAVKKQAAWKNIGSDINVLMGRILLDKPKGLRMENFSASKQFVIKEMIKYQYPYPYLEGLILRVTKRIKMVDMEERERADDKGSGFTFKRSVSLWVNGFTAFSVKPLRISTIVGSAAAFAGFVYGIISVIRKIINPAIPMGYTSLLVLLLFIGGLILMSLGLLGEYIGRMYICLNRSPQYVIKNIINV